MRGTLLIGVALALGQIPAAAADEPIEINAAVAPPLPPAEPAAAMAVVRPDRWLLQKVLQGSGPGIFLDSERMTVSGWIEAGYTGSSAAVNNAPLILNDLANTLALNQAWARLERTVVTSGTTEPTFGFRADFVGGTDYRFTLPRGLWNSQLFNRPGTQSLYGVDLVQHYLEGYLPTVVRGLDIKIGRWYAPFGSESLEAPGRPLYSVSYAASTAPFTHLGGLATLTLSPRWTVQVGAANGNSVWFDQSAEGRFVGTIKYTAPNKKDAITFGTSVGRGSMNTGDPLNVPTFAGIDEPAGRENVNSFDLVWTHTFNPRISYQLEAIYAYQSAVPANVAGGIINTSLAIGQPGTAHYGSLVQYLFLNWTPLVGSAFRLEFFDDFEGQQTGFEGLYTEFTAGVQFKMKRQPSGLAQILFRPELRYDYNGYSQPFEGRHGLFTAAADLILRW